jgi:hypothetical protein
MGGHLRLKHGIVEHKVVENIKRELTPEQHTLNVSSTQVQHKSTQVKPELNVSSTQVKPELPIKVKLPSTYVKKNEKVISYSSAPAFEKPKCVEGDCLCTICRGKMELLKCDFSRHPYMDGKAVICNDCLKKFKKNDLQGEWWIVPDTNNQKINVTSNHFLTEKCKLLSEYIKSI